MEFILNHHNIQDWGSNVIFRNSEINLKWVVYCLMQWWISLLVGMLVKDVATPDCLAASLNGLVSNLQLPHCWTGLLLYLSISIGCFSGTENWWTNSTSQSQCILWLGLEWPVGGLLCNHYAVFWLSEAALFPLISCFIIWSNQEES